MIYVIHIEYTFCIQSSKQSVSIRHDYLILKIIQNKAYAVNIEHIEIHLLSITIKESVFYTKKAFDISLMIIFPTAFAG